jgi:hypothetical protein
VYRLIAVVCLCASIAASAESPVPLKPTRALSAPKAQLAPPQVVVEALPVRKVVLYKNGVGYFEHAGAVTGNQRVSIDFTSSQLNDVLQSLTVLDEGGGHIAGVNYNSTTPLAEQLKTLALGMTDDPTSTELFQALRGRRVEVTGGPASGLGGGAITGRLMSIESRAEKKQGDDDTTIDRFYLTVVASSGAVRVIELTPTLSVRPLDANLQGQLDRYLELLSSAHSTGLRHLTLNALGQGQRPLRVSYISEVPVWKSTYRIVFPHSGANSKAIVQGWAVVDNTVGADWDNVQLSLVAGSPQSFIQPLSQPLYMRRQLVAIATGVETAPQTHEAALGFGTGGISGTITDASGGVIADATVTITAIGGNTVATANTSESGSFSVPSLPPGTYSVNVVARGFQTYVQRNVRVGGARAANVNAALRVGSESQAVTVEAAPPPMAAPAVANFVVTGRNEAALASLGAGGYAGGVYRPTDAISEGDVSTNAFDDFFEYSLAQPVTIHKNESAMVPILQQELPAEHVSLWNPNQRSPLRAVWLENKSKLTLDAGSFSIFESGEFAGEGLLDPIHPGEKRLLSYANDQAVKMAVSDRVDNSRIHHLTIRKGSIIETWMQVQGATYTANNNGDEDRVVLIEHPRHTGESGWALDGSLQAAETTSTLYRLRLTVPAHDSAKIEVHEHGPQSIVVNLQQQPEQREFVLELTRQIPDAKAQLQPVLDAQDVLADINEQIAKAKKAEETAAADEARYRENVTALKGSDGAKRFVDELNHAEDQLQAMRKQIADLEARKAAAAEKLDRVISGLSYDWNETESR